VLVLKELSLIKLISLTLNHGVYDTRHATTRDEAALQVEIWRPHLVIFDCDLDNGALVKLIGTRASGDTRVPPFA
jgi:hypothetical protein